MVKSKELTEIVEGTVLCSRTGRSLASIGAILTNAEQERQDEVYSRLKVGEEVRGRSSVIALITQKKGKASKIPQGEAIKWFINQYPQESLPLQEKMSEKKPGETRTLLAYGLKEGRELSDELYVNTIVGYTNCGKEQAALLYYGFLKPQLERSNELQGLVEVRVEK